MRYDGEPAPLRRHPPRLGELGFVGTGAITSAIVTGLCTHADVRCRITVSPRNAACAASLATAFPLVRIAADNQAVLDDSDVVFLAVRPQIVRQVVGELRFKPEHRVISLVATYSRHTIAELVRPATSVVCAVPLPTVAFHEGPTAMFPPDAGAASIFQLLGGAIEVATETELHALWAATATMATHFRFLHTIASWLSARGVPQERARDYVVTMFAGLARAAARRPEPLEQLAGEFATRGGLNEQCVAALERAGAFDACSEALDAVRARIEGGTAAAMNRSSELP
jgi:pyrroline-5-carboxylate reductase